MNKKIIIASIASLSLFAVAGVSTLMAKPNTFGFLTKATNEVPHTIVFDHDSEVLYDDVTTYVYMVEYTDHGNLFECDSNSYIYGDHVDFNGADYLFRAGGNGYTWDTYFRLGFELTLDIDEAENITVVMNMKKKVKNKYTEEIAYGELEELEPYIFANNNEALVEFEFNNEENVFEITVESIVFTYSCSY